MKSIAPVLSIALICCVPCSVPRANAQDRPAASEQDTSPKSVPANPAPSAEASKSSDVNGKWHFVLDTPGGDREVDSEFKVSDGQVTGTWGTQPAVGTYRDGKVVLDFAFNSDEAGQGQMKINGTVDGDSMTGTWAFSDYNGTFKATRTKTSSGG